MAEAPGRPDATDTVQRDCPIARSEQSRCIGAIGDALYQGPRSGNSAGGAANRQAYVLQRHLLAEQQRAALAVYFMTRNQISVLAPNSNTLIFSNVIWTSICSNRRRPLPSKTGM